MKARNLSVLLLAVGFGTGLTTSSVRAEEAYRMNFEPEEGAAANHREPALTTLEAISEIAEISESDVLVARIEPFLVNTNWKVRSYAFDRLHGRARKGALLGEDVSILLESLSRAAIRESGGILEETFASKLCQFEPQQFAQDTLSNLRQYIESFDQSTLTAERIQLIDYFAEDSDDRISSLEFAEGTRFRSKDWKVLLARTRRGDDDAAIESLAAVFAEHEPGVRLDALKELIGTNHRYCLWLGARWILSDERFPGIDGADGGPLAARVAVIVSQALIGFPVRHKNFWNFDQDGLNTCRLWISDQQWLRETNLELPNMFADRAIAFRGTERELQFGELLLLSAEQDDLGEVRFERAREYTRLALSRQPTRFQVEVAARLNVPWLGQILDRLVVLDRQQEPAYVPIWQSAYWAALCVRAQQGSDQEILRLLALFDAQDNPTKARLMVSLAKTENSRILSELSTYLDKSEVANSRSECHEERTLAESAASAFLITQESFPAGRIEERRLGEYRSWARNQDWYQQENN